jgi:glycogen synthase
MLDRCTENQCIALGKTEGVIKNRQSRDAGNIVNTIVTQYDDKQSKKHKTESYKNEQYRLTKKREWTHVFTKVNDFNFDV